MRNRFVILASFATALTVACGSQGMRKGGDGAVATGGAPDGAVVTGGIPDGAVATGGAPGGGADALLTPDSASDVKGTGGAADAGDTGGTGGTGNSHASVGTGGEPGSDGPTARGGTGITDGPMATGGAGGSDAVVATAGTGSGGIAGANGTAGMLSGRGGGPAGGRGGPLPPGISSFAASPGTIVVGQSSTLSWMVTGATTLSIDQSIGSVLGATSVVVAPSQTTTYTLALNGSVLRQVTVTVIPAGFWATGSMTVARSKHTATLLANGKVLIAGGVSGGASAELFDPAVGTFTATGSMAVARQGHSATLLPNDKVLITGGGGGANAELYDPAAGKFAATGSLTVPRNQHTATLLPSGMVLVAGGAGGSSGLASAELYDPATGTFTATGNLTVPRYGHGAALLPSGMVLIVGGMVSVTISGLNTIGLAGAELYDARAGVFAATGRMGMGRSSPTETLLPNGTVLMAGGQLGFEGWIASDSLELYDPATGTFASTGRMTEARSCYTATLLPSGLVLIAGGDQGGGFGDNFLASAELYDPAAGTCTATGSMAAKREFHTATLLANGTVLIAGGDSQGSELASAEFYK